MTSQHDNFIIIKNEVNKLATHMMEAFIATNEDARAAFNTPSTSNTQGTAVATAITDAFNNIGSNSSLSAPDSTTKKYNLAAIKLLCVHFDDQTEFGVSPRCFIHASKSLPNKA